MSQTPFVAILSGVRLLATKCTLDAISGDPDARIIQSDARAEILKQHQLQRASSLHGRFLFLELMINVCEGSR